MNIDKPEEYKREIDKTKWLINSLKKHIKSNDFINPDELKVRFEENIKKLDKLEKSFEFIIQEYKNRNLLKNWVNKHMSVTENMINFPVSIYFKKQYYTSERIENLKIINNLWKDFSEKEILPDTYLFEDYNLFFDMKEFEDKYKINIQNIKINQIKKLENIRQKITKLRYSNFVNDTLLDKGEAWGAKKEDVENAEKNYRLIDAQIQNQNKELQSLINKFGKDDSIIIQEWIYLHLKTCTAIASQYYCNNDYNDDTRLGVATETFYGWINVNKQKEIKTFMQNLYYLSDYDSVFNIVLDT